MGLFDRIVLTIFTLLVAAVSALVLASAATGWIVPLEVVREALLDENGRWLAGILSSALLVVSLRFIYFGFRRRHPLQTLVHETGLGRVQVTVRAIENLVGRVARQAKGVREARPRVLPASDGVRVWVRTTVSPEANIPALTEDIQRNITSYVKNVVGVDVTSVQVFVENISNEPRRGRVE